MTEVFIKKVFLSRLRTLCMLGLLLTVISCHGNRNVNISFYYWKTRYQLSPVERAYLDQLHTRKLYLRIMDVDNGDNGPQPVSPILFKDAVPDSIQVVPVIFIVNEILKKQSRQQLNDLAGKMSRYVDAKMKQAGKAVFEEIQIDCDWTQTTRDNYFYLLKRFKADKILKGKQLSATLRLHQLKYQQSSGVPPVSRVMLMCYNMGNLRRYGTQNSILEQAELEKYAGAHLKRYAIPMDVGLPLFSWAVVFREKQYAGIARRITPQVLNDTATFKPGGKSLYSLQHDLPTYGLKRGDEIRWESLSPAELKTAAAYIENYLPSGTLNIIYFHLDENTLKNYTYETLEETAAVFH